MEVPKQSVGKPKAQGIIPDGELQWSKILVRNMVQGNPLCILFPLACRNGMQGYCGGGYLGPFRWQRRVDATLL